MSYRHASRLQTAAGMIYRLIPIYTYNDNESPGANLNSEVKLMEWIDDRGKCWWRIKERESTCFGSNTSRGFSLALSLLEFI